MNAEVTLPGELQVLLRGWLSANNILARGASETVLIDSGYVTHAPQTVALVAHALAGDTLARLVNTHCHSDHMGGNRAIQLRFDCRTTIPIGEAPLIDAWDERSLMLGFADQRAERFRYDDVLAPGDSLQMGDLDWQVLAAPGHDTHALMFYAPQPRVLVSGDALWQNGFGVIFPQLYGRDSAFRETRETLERIASLDIAVVIPGHGRTFADVGAALERAFARLDSFEQDILRLVRHTVKVMFTFALLEKQAMPLADLPSYVAGVGVLRDLNERYLRMTPSALAQWLVRDLERVGAVACEDGMLLPRVAA